MGVPEKRNTLILLEYRAPLRALGEIGRKGVNSFVQFFSAKVSENERKRSENARVKIWAGVGREKTGCIRDARAKTARERKQSKL